MRHFARVVIQVEDKFLLLFTTKEGRNRWEFPGGKVEPGESPSQTAIREVNEEVGIVPRELVFLGTDSNLLLDGERWVGHFYSCKEWDGTPTIKEPSQFSSMGWFTIPEMGILSTVPCLSIDMAWKARMPRIVCLCGSTKFRDEFMQANYQETMKGNIVLSVGFFVHSPTGGESVGCTAEQKIALDELHKRKIDLADEILVLNVGGYIGSSTRSEIDYAIAHGKPVRYLEKDILVKDYSFQKTEAK